MYHMYHITSHHMYHITSQHITTYHIACEPPHRIALACRARPSEPHRWNCSVMVSPPWALSSMLMPSSMGPLQKESPSPVVVTELGVVYVWDGDAMRVLCS